MKFIEKVNSQKINNEPLKIVFFGDSITQGCFEIFIKENNDLDGIYDNESVYHNQFKQMMKILYPNVVLDIINAGISGDSATGALTRLDKDVLSHKPDIVVVCFGLNDAPAGLEGLERYMSSLSQIFARLRQNNIDTIFMTPNMYNNSVSTDLKEDLLINLAKQFMKLQNENIFDKYIEKAKELCYHENIAICDCYSKWLKIEQCGVDVTNLLANRLNHPTREMHKLFAVSLIETMMNT